MTTSEHTRESWLEHAVEVFRPKFSEIQFPLPDRIHVSVGFAYGARRENKVILGQCWRREASDDGINHVFISPEIGNTFDVLETLLHELIHAADNVESGHMGGFKSAALMLGFTTPMRSTPSTPQLAAELRTITDTLGEYPHGALHPVGAAGGPKPQSGPPKQGTRMIKVECPECGYSVRTTRTWLDIGVPSCPDGTPMEEAS